MVQQCPCILDSQCNKQPRKRGDMPCALDRGPTQPASKQQMHYLKVCDLYTHFYAINCKALPHGLNDRQVPLVMTVGRTYSLQTLYVAPNDAPEVDFLCMCGWDSACTWGNARISMPLEESDTP